MKKKINTYLVLTVFVTLIITLSMAVAVFHRMYQKQVINDMRIYTELLCDMIESGEELKERITDTREELRVTAIGENGIVKFDSKAGEDQMGNHGDRPEVQKAKEAGEGHAVRHSDTLDSDMYYYAFRMENGDILRISKEESSIWGVFTGTIYGMIGIAVLMLLFCLGLSKYMTNSLIRPIEKLAEDMNNSDGIDAYEELVPFITTIQNQHADILKNAKMRQEFTANVSHELKTPLTSISGYAELIETGIAGENDIQRFAKEIHRCSRRLLSLINDIIKLAELDSDQMEMSYGEIDLHDVAGSCVEMLQMHAQKHDIQITYEGYRCLIHGDKGLIEELVYNLCDNAIRYNKTGGTVNVSVGMRGYTTVLTVKDTGIGIPQESQQRVFERFYRVDKSRSKSTGGTGLGLAIVKHIVAQHNAHLEMKSEVGVGTEITVLFEE